MMKRTKRLLRTERRRHRLLSRHQQNHHRVKLQRSQSRSSRMFPPIQKMFHACVAQLTLNESINFPATIKFNIFIHNSWFYLLNDNLRASTMYDDISSCIVHLRYLRWFFGKLRWSTIICAQLRWVSIFCDKFTSLMLAYKLYKLLVEVLNS